MSHTEESFHNNDEKPVLRELHKEKIVPTHAAVSAVDSEAREALHTLQALNDVTEEERGRGQYSPALLPGKPSIDLFCDNTWQFSAS